jgi:hypothetical protein
MLHAILTKRILLNLREAASQSYSPKTEWTREPNPHWPHFGSALSSVIVSVDVWLTDVESNSSNPAL